MRYMWLALWGSIQLFFIASLSTLVWKVSQIHRIVRRYELSCWRSVQAVKKIEASITENGHS